ncbi:MAG: cysteine synthase family protein [Firmicutes bacterium]|nr:cysteine synthase family protein [Bacillota bacterium]
MKTKEKNSYWPFLNYELPRLSRLSDNLYGASFFLMKLLPARFILQQAEEKGIIGRGSRIIESTSGTFGLGLAILSAVKGYQLTLVSDPVIDPKLYNRLRDLGAKVEIIETYYPEGGYQKARLNKVYEHLKESPDTFWTEQYSNKYNPRSYKKVSDFLLNEIGNIDFLVGPVGSGGSMCGTSRYLREYLPNLKVVGVDTCKSILFGQENGNRLLRGLGNSVMPQILDHSTFDLISWVPANIAFRVTRELHQTHGLYMGGTSGAAYHVAKWISDKFKDAKVVTFFPDEGHRYTETIYTDQWLEEIPGINEVIPKEPKKIQFPKENEESWTVLNWNRRSLEDVLSLNEKTQFYDYK